MHVCRLSEIWYELVQPKEPVKSGEKNKFSENTVSSIDYLIMEKIIEKNISTKVIPMDIGWSDLGSWNSFWENKEKDSKGNVLYGKVLEKDSRDSLFYSEDKTLVALGMEGVVVVNTPDAVLVAHKNNSEGIKAVVDAVKEMNPSLVELPRKVSRPWGTYEIIDESDTFKVKRIVVAPGQKLSKQSHKMRSETWVVVTGKAKVELGEEEFILGVNDSVYIPAETTHRLENPESYELELIEIQTGTYFGEDDIKRYEDDYGRE